MKRLIIILVAFLYVFSISAQNGYDIKIRTINFKKDTLLVSYTYFNQVLVLDTIYRNSEGYFSLKSEALLPGGLYYIGPKYYKKKFEFIISPSDCNFEMDIDFRNKPPLKFKDSKENELYRRYKVSAHRNKKLFKQFRKKKNYAKKDSVALVLNKLREKFAKKLPNSVAALLVRSEIDWVNPKVENASMKQKDKEKLDYKINHFLDKLDLSSPYVTRIPNTFNIINEYLDKVLKLDGESVIPALDKMLSEMGVRSEMYKFYLPFLRRKYMYPYNNWVDKVYIHLVRKYYNKEMAPWVSKSEIEGVQIQADRRESTLVGKVLPDITLSTEKGKKVSLHEIKAKYTVLIFWKPGCSHCRHAMPYMNEFQKKYKKEGVKIVGVCTRKGDDSKRCWKSIKEEKMQKFHYNLADVEGKENFLMKYNLIGVPIIYILDENKVILDKKVPPEVLIDVFSRIVK